MKKIKSTEEQVITEISEDDYPDVLKACGCSLCDNFQITDINRPMYLYLLKYFVNHVDLSPEEKKKGLLLMGNYGSGKTLAMRTFDSFLIKIKRFGYYMFNSSELIDAFTTHGRPGISLFNRDYAICIDDLGSDPGKHAYFGELDDPTEVLLLKRYEMFVKSGIRTHATTNLDPKTLKLRFSERIYDRMRQMFNIVVFNGESWRRLLDKQQ